MQIVNGLEHVMHNVFVARTYVEHERPVANEEERLHGDGTAELKLVSYPSIAPALGVVA